MPRGRPRKVGLRRQDAAMDAMRELGFEREKVKKTLNKLLKVYEGDAGWIFIEEFSYKLLVETLLEDADEGENCCSSKIDYPATTSGQIQDDYAATISGQIPDDHAATIFSAPSDAHSPAATPPLADPPSPLALPPPIAALPSPLYKASLPAAVSPPTAELAAAEIHEKDVVHTPQTLDPHPKKRRNRFHGWIHESPEHLLDLRGLIPPKKLEQVMNRIERRGKRKSRWDVRPEDM